MADFRGDRRASGEIPAPRPRRPRASRNSKLSNIPENARVEARLFFALIGPGAWQLGEDLTRKAEQAFPSLAPKKWFSLWSSTGNSGNRLALPVAQTATGSSGSSRNNKGPFTCKVLLDEDLERDRERDRDLVFGKDGTSSLSSPGPVSGHAYEIKVDGRSRRSLASRASRVSSTRASSVSVPSQTSRYTRSGTDISMASSKSSSSDLRRRMAAITYTPVERFADEVPMTKSVERLRQSCLLFLVDSRLEAAGTSLVPELLGRQQEVNMWMKLNNPKMTGVNPSPNDEQPPINAFVIFHRPPRAWQSGTDSQQPCIGDEISEGSGAFGCEAKYLALVDGARELANAPPGATMWYTCNFDDIEEVFRVHMRIAQTIVDRPEVQFKGLDSDLFRDSSTDTGSSRCRGGACCSVM